MKQYLTAEQFEEKIKNEFNNLTEEKFNRLILFSATIADMNQNEFILGIAKSCKQSKTITLKQYKALSAFLTTQKKKENTKTFGK